MEHPPWLVPATDQTEFYTAERCYITELLNSEQSPQLSVALARVRPGVATQLHALRGVDETYLLRNGHGIVEVNSQARQVRSGDSVVIPAGASQRISNCGDEDLEFYCFCTPRFTAQCYIDLESA